MLSEGTKARVAAMVRVRVVAMLAAAKARVATVRVVAMLAAAKAKGWAMSWEARRSSGGTVSSKGEVIKTKTGASEDLEAQGRITSW